MSSNTIAVCIISYNQRDYLIKAIESVLAQTRLPDQIIVIDDMSSDDTAQVLQKYKLQAPDLFTIKINKSNMGNGTTRHHGVKLSRCQWTTCLDGDDLYYPDKLKQEERCLVDNPDVEFVYSNFSLIDDEGHAIRSWAADIHNVPTGDVFEDVVGFGFPGGILCRFPLTNTASLVEATRHAQGFSLYEDFVILMRLSWQMKSAFVKNVNTGYRLHDGCVHRTHHEGHSNVLEKIFIQNMSLFDNLDPTKRVRVKKKFRRILSTYAWRAVKDHAKRPSRGSKRKVVGLARRAMRHDPLALRPKHVFRVLVAQLKSPKFPPATISG